MTGPVLYQIDFCHKKGFNALRSPRLPKLKQLCNGEAGLFGVNGTTGVGVARQVWDMRFFNKTSESGLPMENRKWGLSQFFRERELVLRSEGEVSFIRLGPKVQMVLASVAAAFLLWTAGSTVLAWHRGESLSLKHQEIAEAKLAYSSILEEVTDYQNNLDKLSQSVANLSQSEDGLSPEFAQTVLAFADQGHALRQDLHRITSDLTMPVEDRERLIVSRAMLHDRIENLEEELKQGLEETGARLAAVQLQQKQTGMRLVRLGRKFNGAVSDADAPDAVPVGVEAQARFLEESGRGILKALEDSRKQANSANNALERVLSGLTKVTEVAQYKEEETKKPSNMPAPDQALRLIGSLEGLHDTQVEMVARLTDATSDNIDMAEGILSNLGLDVDHMLGLAGFAMGQGGPLEEIEEGEVGTGNLSLGVAVLETKVKRWTALQELLRCTPMISPVDYYHLTSPFGPRKDPITGRTAMHKGVDMGGWPGTSVYATAAGQVVQASNAGRYGRMVEIDHGCGIRTRYGHLKKILVQKGQQVNYRTEIGKLGSSGRSTGPHVHYEIRIEGKAVNPAEFIEGGRYVFKS